MTDCCCCIYVIEQLLLKPIRMIPPLFSLVQPVSSILATAIKLNAGKMKQTAYANDDDDNNGLKVIFSSSCSASAKLLDVFIFGYFMKFPVLSCLLCEFDRPIWILFDCMEARPRATQPHYCSYQGSWSLLCYVSDLKMNLTSAPESLSCMCVFELLFGLKRLAVVRQAIKIFDNW